MNEEHEKLMTRAFNVATAEAAAAPVLCNRINFTTDNGNSQLVISLGGASMLEREPGQFEARAKVALVAVMDKSVIPSLIEILTRIQNRGTGDANG